MKLEVRQAIDGGNDMLLIGGVAISDTGEEKPIVAQGWVSATTNHYDPEDYDPETGHLKDDAEPREMTKDEILAYCQRLLEEQNAGLVQRSLL